MHFGHCRATTELPGCRHGCQEGVRAPRGAEPCSGHSIPIPLHAEAEPRCPQTLVALQPLPRAAAAGHSPVSSPHLPAPVSHHENLGPGLPAALHLPKPSPPRLLPCQGSRCGISDANMVTLQLLEVPQEQWDLLRGRGGPQRPAGMLRSPANLQLIASGENSVIKRRAHRGAKQQEGKRGARREGA